LASPVSEKKEEKTQIEGTPEKRRTVGLWAGKKNATRKITGQTEGRRLSMGGRVKRAKRPPSQKQKRVTGLVGSRAGSEVKIFSTRKTATCRGKKAGVQGLSKKGLQKKTLAALEKKGRFLEGGCVCKTPTENLY